MPPDPPVDWVSTRFYCTIEGKTYEWKTGFRVARFQPQASTRWYFTFDGQTYEYKPKCFVKEGYYRLSELKRLGGCIRLLEGVPSND